MRRLCPKLFHWLQWQRWPYHERRELLLSLYYCVVMLHVGIAVAKLLINTHIQPFVNHVCSSKYAQTLLLHIFTWSSQELLPKNQTEMKVLVAHQVSTKPIRCWVCHEDYTLDKSIAGTVYICLLQCCSVWCLKLSFVHLHKIALFTQTSNGADIVQRLTRYLEKDGGKLNQSFDKYVKYFW